MIGPLGRLGAAATLGQMTQRPGKAMLYVPDWTRIGIIAVAAPLIDLKAVFAEHRWGLLNHTAPLFAQFRKTKTAINNRALLYILEKVLYVILAVKWHGIILHCTIAAQCT